MRLYKYVRPDGIDILRSRRVKFTPPIHFNDPFDVAPSLDRLIPDDQLPALLREAFPDRGRAIFEQTVLEHLNDEQRTALADIGLTYEALSEHGVDLVSIIESSMKNSIPYARATFPGKFQTEMSERFGVLVLTENPESVVMWAHYADSCKGLVFGFDADHPFLAGGRKGRIPGIAPIRYVQERAPLTFFDRSRDEDEWLQSIVEETMFTKSIEWSYEREWRAIRSLNKADSVEDGRHYFKFPGEALVSVIVGPRTPAEVEKEVRSIIMQDGNLSHVEVLRATVSVTRYELELKPLSSLES